LAQIRGQLFLMNHWLVKQEPSAYSWDDFVRDGRTAWTGVRNFQARNNLQAMRVGDRVLFYHSVTGKCIVGEARVARTAYPDPTASEGDWVCVDLVPHKAFPSPVSLERIKAEPTLCDLALLRQSRLSVMPVTAAEYRTLTALAQT
jgi:predicted RNA-binding protein with PUA-like domain